MVRCGAGIPLKMFARAMVATVHRRTIRMVGAYAVDRHGTVSYGTTYVVDAVSAVTIGGRRAGFTIRREDRNAGPSKSVRGDVGPVTPFATDHVGVLEVGHQCLSDAEERFDEVGDPASFEWQPDIVSLSPSEDVPGGRFTDTRYPRPVHPESVHHRVGVFLVFPDGRDGHER